MFLVATEFAKINIGGRLAPSYAKGEFSSPQSIPKLYRVLGNIDKD